MTYLIFKNIFSGEQIALSIWLDPGPNFFFYQGLNNYKLKQAFQLEHFLLKYLQVYYGDLIFLLCNSEKFGGAFYSWDIYIKVGFELCIKILKV